MVAVALPALSYGSLVLWSVLNKYPIKLLYTWHPVLGVAFFVLAGACLPGGRTNSARAGGSCVILLPACPQLGARPYRQRRPQPQRQPGVPCLPCRPPQPTPPPATRAAIGAATAQSARAPGRHKAAITLHGYINVAATLCALGCAAVIYLNKEMHGKQHLKSWHGRLGAATVLLCVIQQGVSGAGCGVGALLLAWRVLSPARPSSAPSSGRTSQSHSHGHWQWHAVVQAGQIPLRTHAPPRPPGVDYVCCWCPACRAAPLLLLLARTTPHRTALQRLGLPSGTSPRPSGRRAPSCARCTRATPLADTPRCWPSQGRTSWPSRAATRVRASALHQGERGGGAGGPQGGRRRSRRGTARGRVGSKLAAPVAANNGWQPGTNLGDGGALRVVVPPSVTVSAGRGLRFTAVEHGSCEVTA